MATTAPTPTPAAPSVTSGTSVASGTDRPGLALLVITTVQLLMVLDVTIVNIALPAIQADLDLTLETVEWTVTGYALAFGGLLLLGGRLGDVLGRRAALVVGVALFGLASLAAGMAGGPEVLLGSRVLQGAGAALASPAALALIPAAFPDPARRARAMGVYAAMSGVGAATGLVLGGTLAEWVSWRWVFLLAAPFALLVLVLAPVALPEPPRRRVVLPVTSAVAAASAAATLVLGVSRAAAVGWTAPETAGWIGAAAVLAVCFVILEARRPDPLLPRGQLALRHKQVAWASTFLLGGAMLGTLFFTTQLLQHDLGFTPFRAGVGFLPFSLAMVLVSQYAARALARTSAWNLVASGAAVAAAAAVVLATVDAGQGYAQVVLPALVAEGIGFGLLFVPVTTTCVAGTPPQEVGVVAGLTSTMQQLGGAVLLAAMVSISAAGTGGHRPDPSVAFLLVASALAVVSVAAVVTARTRAGVVRR